MRHAYLTIVNNSHAIDFFFVTGIFFSYTVAKLLIDFFYYSMLSGQKSVKSLFIPIFQSFFHDSMICIITDLPGYFKSFCKRNIMVFYKSSYEFDDN